MSLSPYEVDILQRALRGERTVHPQLNLAGEALRKKDYLTDEERAMLLAQTYLGEERTFPTRFKDYGDFVGPPEPAEGLMGKLAQDPRTYQAVNQVGDIGTAMGSMASPVLGVISGLADAADVPDPEYTGEWWHDTKENARVAWEGWNALGAGIEAGIHESIGRAVEGGLPLWEALKMAGPSMLRHGLTPRAALEFGATWSGSKQDEYNARLERAREAGRQYHEGIREEAAARGIDTEAGTGAGMARRVLDPEEHYGPLGSLGHFLNLPEVDQERLMQLDEDIRPVVAKTPLIGEHLAELEMNRESLGEVGEYLDIGMVTPGAIASYAKLVRGGATMGRVVATQGPRNVKFAAIHTLAKGLEFREARRFTREAARVGARNGFSPEQTAAFIDAVLDVTPTSANPNAMAGLIQREGLSKAAQWTGMTQDQVKRLEAALGNARPADFGVRIDRGARELDKAREALLAQFSTLDPATELKLVIARKRAATILPAEVSDTLVAEAMQAGLAKPMIVDNVMGLPKGHNRLRVFYDPELLEGIYRGLVSSPRADLRSLVAGGAKPGIRQRLGLGKRKTSLPTEDYGPIRPDPTTDDMGKQSRAWLRRMVRKDPARLAYLSSGTLGGDMVGGVRVVLGSRSLRAKVRRARQAVKATEKGQPYTHERMALEGGFHTVEGEGAELSSLVSRELRQLKKDGKLPLDYEIHIEGTRIEELATKAGIPDEFLRSIQDRLRKTGLTHDETLALTGGLIGDVDPLLRSTLMDDAARRLAARGAEGGDDLAARRMLDRAVEELQKGAPQQASFGQGHSLRAEHLWPRAEAEIPTKEMSAAELPDEAVEVGGHAFRQVAEPERVGNYISVSYEDGATVELLVGDREIHAAIQDLAGQPQELGKHSMPALEFALQQGEKLGKPVVFAPVTAAGQTAPLSNRTKAVLRGMVKDGRVAEQGGRYVQRLGRTTVTEEPARGAAWFHPRRAWETTWEMHQARLAGRAQALGEPLPDDLGAVWRSWYEDVTSAVSADGPVPVPVMQSARASVRSKLDALEASMKDLVESPFQDGLFAGAGERVLSAGEVSTRLQQIENARRHMEFWDDKLSQAMARQDPSSLSAVGPSAADEELLRKFTGQRPGRPRHAMPMDRVGSDAGWEGDVVESMPMGDLSDTGRQLKVKLDDGRLLDVPESDVSIVRPREHHPEVAERVRKMLQLEDQEFAKGAEYAQLADEMMGLDRRRVGIGDQLAKGGKPDPRVLEEFDSLTKRIDEIRDALRVTDGEAATLLKAREAEAAALRAQFRVVREGESAPRGMTSVEADQAARSGELDPSTVVREEGEPMSRALAQQDQASKEGWERSDTWGQRGWYDEDGRPRGPENPRFVDMAEGGKGPDVSNILVRNVDELEGLSRVWRGQFVWEWLTSPQVAFLNRLGLSGEQLSKRWIQSYQRRQRYLDLGREMAAQRNKTLRSKTDRYLAGRFLENDFAAIPKDWATEVMSGSTKRAIAVQRYLEQYRQATERVADHVRLPQFRRLSDYFAHLSDPKAIVKGLKDDLKAAKKSRNAKRIDQAERRLKNWRDAELVKMERQDWELAHMPKGVYYGPLEQRLDKMTDYIKDPEKVMRMLEQQSARFRQIDELVDHYETLAVASKHEVTAKRIREAKRLLFEPKSSWQQRLDNFLVRNIANPWKGWMHGFIDPNIIDRMSQLTRWAGFIMNLGFRPTSAIMNLTSIPMHTLLRLGWASPTDLAHGTGRFLLDQGLSGNLISIGPLSRLKPHVGRKIPSDIYEMWQDRIAGSVPKHWELPVEHGVDASWVGDAMTKGQEMAMEVAGFLFRSTESLNRGASFYTGAVRAYRAIDHYTANGSLRHAPSAGVHRLTPGDTNDFDFFDGFIAPRREDLMDELKLMRKRVGEWELHESKGRGEFARGDMDAIEPQGYMSPGETKRVRAILDGPGDDFDKAVKLFDPERRIREAIEQQRVQEFVADIATEVTDETQFIYTKQNRPVGIVRNNAWAGTVFQFMDFTRSQLEFLGQRLPFIVKRKVRGKAVPLPGPGLAFLGMLWAIGGPRAMPFVEFLTQVAGVANPDLEDDIEEALTVMRDWRPGKGVKWLNDGEGLPTNLATLGLELANRIRPGFDPPRSSEPFKDAHAGYRFAGSFGGAFLEPIVKAYGSVAAASDIAATAEEVHGVPSELAGQVGTLGRSGGLKLRSEDIDPEKLRFNVMGVPMPLGKVLMSETGRWAANIPAEAAKTAGLHTLGAALEVREGSKPGTINLPGDNITGLIAALRESVRGAVQAEGVARRRGKLVTPTGDLAATAAEWFGLTSSKEQDVRREARRMAKTAKGIDEAGVALLEYAINIYRRPDGSRASVLDIQEIMANHNFFLSPSDIHQRIISKEHSLFVRQVSQLSKQANKHFMEKENLAKRLDEEVTDLSDAGLVAAEQAARAQYMASARKFWGQVRDEMALGDGLWTTEMRDELLLEYRKTGDEYLNDILKEAMANFTVGKVGVESLKLDPLMEDMHIRLFRDNADKPVADRVKDLKRWLQKETGGDAVKFHKMLELGLWMLEQEGKADPEVQEALPGRRLSLRPGTPRSMGKWGFIGWANEGGKERGIRTREELVQLVKNGYEIRGTRASRFGGWSPDHLRAMVEAQQEAFGKVAPDAAEMRTGWYKGRYDRKTGERRHEVER